MRAASPTRRQAAGNRFAAVQTPVAAAIVRADTNRPVTGRTRHPLPPAPIAADMVGCAVTFGRVGGRADTDALYAFLHFAPSVPVVRVKKCRAASRSYAGLRYWRVRVRLCC